MVIFNTLSREKETFKPIRKTWVGLYTCGPTVYNYAHIGNLRTYIFEDILERTLVWNGYDVRRVMNITDVGHLTSDADAGEDKIQREAEKEKRSVWDVAQFYTEAFLEDFKKLNIKIPKRLDPATKFIKEQIKLIERLFERGLAYETSKAIYFNVPKFKNYTKLSKQPLNEKIVAARNEVISDPEKRHPADFVLWFKLIDRFKNHIMRWSSPWGMGFPGWHIECSAISTSRLGQPFDIHTGGVDHINVHHTNEIAQSEGAIGKPLARYWMHAEFLIINEARMGKSEGNFITLSKIKEKDINPLAYRYFTLTAHYRSKLNFTWEALQAAQRAFEKLSEEISLLKRNLKRVSAKQNTETYLKRFTKAINDDLNTPQVLAILWETVKSSKLSPNNKLKLILIYDQILGLNLKNVKKPPIIPQNIIKLAEQRELLRANKQFIQSDALRKQINKLGYVVKDTATGSTISKKL
ncbi:cysteine--tRNA ligase [Candidatus Jorgensenbacteria bacterium]|nr:cysteine--tRNA ligase [Candidatus Jorgensenbacteria bacterium]